MPQPWKPLSFLVALFYLSMYAIISLRHYGIILSCIIAIKALVKLSPFFIWEYYVLIEVQFTYALYLY